MALSNRTQATESPKMQCRKLNEINTQKVQFQLAGQALSF